MVQCWSSPTDEFLFNAHLDCRDELRSDDEDVTSAKSVNNPSGDESEISENGRVGKYNTSSLHSQKVIYMHKIRRG